MSKVVQKLKKSLSKHSRLIFTLSFSAFFTVAGLLFWGWLFPPKEFTVNITSNGFEPKTVTVSQGGVVIWRNKDTMDHRVASGAQHHESNHSGWMSHHTMPPGQNYYNHFHQKGTFEYHDPLHPEFKGTVIVR